MEAPQLLDLWPAGSPNRPEGFHPRLKVFRPAKGAPRRRSAVLVFPGGGYAGHAPHEAEPFAELFASRGHPAAVAWYRVAPHAFPAPVADGCRAMRLFRSLAPGLGFDPARVALLGFSAGGHLASTLATQPDCWTDPHDDLAGRLPARPNAAILAYPVISFSRSPHAGSRRNFLGREPTPAEEERFSSERRVDASTPPTFLFHTADDAAVPVANSLAFAEACAAAKVPFALHAFPRGRHGVGLAKDDPVLSAWTGLMLAWLEKTLE
jgi:acetyl esterase/lipase